jgi:hypothetical protein
MPYDGVIVRWSARMPTAADTTTLVFRPLHLTAIGVEPSGGSVPINPPATDGAIVTGTARMRVSAGDLIAVDLDDGDEIGLTSHPLLDSLSWSFVPLLTGDRAPDSIDSDDFEALFNVIVERGADRDGYGDDSQDNCPQLASEWFRTCRGRPVVSVAAGRAGIGVVAAGAHIPVDAAIRGDQQIVAGARLELTLPDGVKPLRLSGTAFCSATRSAPRTRSG